ncbi:MAG TPA: dTDP-glucose 4,6-dehydratase [Candidatus Acidoferrales bacterium]|jgi:dTDP-glucose 4,6-dehydratase|nr:dTDP-glucose 4,6-dehydratase [Candidatus Acidoferrales bacterium]
MRLLITGGAGFIGSNYIRHVLKRHQSAELVILDKLTYAGNVDNLKGLLQDIEFIKGDICDASVVSRVMNECDCVLNFAAETHVDRSIFNSTAFVRTDVLGTQILLDAAKEHQIDRFVQVSTDEVYGSKQRGSFEEIDRLNPSSPYAASKAAADLLAHSYFVTYGFPCIITRSANNYGPYQHPEKLIPRFITRAIRNKTLTVYGKGNNVRDWIHVEDNCRALDCVRQMGKAGEIYNVGAGNEKSNLEVTKSILKLLGKPLNLIRFTADRLGHDYRYSLDCSKIRSLGWQPGISFEDGLLQTVRWYQDNESWWSALV